MEAEQRLEVGGNKADTDKTEDESVGADTAAEGNSVGAPD